MTGKIVHLGPGSQDVPLQDGKIRLYSMRFCPYAHRVHLVLAAKNVPHDIVYINLKEKPDWYLQKYPDGKVPSLVVNGEFLAESLIIADFLDENYKTGKQLHSSDAVRKAKDRLLIERFGKVISSLYKCFLSQSLELSLLEPVFNEMDTFEKALCARGSPFFGGNSPGMVDYMIWPWCERLEMIRVMGGDEFQVPKDRFPKMWEWCKAMMEDPAVKLWAISGENYARFIKSHIAGKPDYDNIL